MTISSNAADGRPAKQETHIATKLAYLSHVDGLRCVAVLSVILFHLDFALFSGGWVGVDVFFVISGFLITRLIVESVERGSFSFGDFYTRRARRVFPALIFTIAVSFLVGCLIFDPIYRQHFAGEVVYALAAVPNLFYWRDGSYFGVAESFKPLLHTWSLGVEEQFYLVWPLALTLLLGLRRVMLWSVLLGAFFISISAADFYYHAGSENAVFFLLPTRIFEFTIGALTVWIVDHRVPERVREGSMLCGLGLVAYAVFGFTPSTPFPSFYALIPCVGTALAIVGGSARRLAQLLSNPPVVWVGKISYSLYLAHWPIIVFYRYHRLMPLSLTEKASLLVATVAIAQLMYS